MMVAEAERVAKAAAAAAEAEVVGAMTEEGKVYQQG